MANKDFGLFSTLNTAYKTNENAMKEDVMSYL
jgi:hypothetical protein